MEYLIKKVKMNFFKYIISNNVLFDLFSVERKSCEPYSIVVWPPARTIKKRFDKEDLKKHIEILEKKDDKCVV